MLPELFSMEANFKQAFRHGLKQILQQPDLGCFILVFANACSDVELYQQMLPDIERQFAVLREALDADALEAGRITATAEDREIFLKIVQQGLATIQAVQYRQAGPWRVQFNQLRTFRPTRMAGKKVLSLRQDFNADAFNFNKPFIQQERLWEGGWQDRQLAWYYNKFPFARYHGLLVPERHQQHPQYLTRALHEYLWDLLQSLAETIPGLGIGYNSLGAFASVNHLHFQWFLNARELPIMMGQWRHNGGGLAYPLACLRFDEPQQAWQGINAWHEQSIAYNLIYTPGALYAIPRQMQGQLVHCGWTSGFSWIETGGEMVMQNANDYAEVSAQGIEQEMYKLNLV